MRALVCILLTVSITGCLGDEYSKDAGSTVEAADQEADQGIAWSPLPCDPGQVHTRGNELAWRTPFDLDADARLAFLNDSLDLDASRPQRYRGGAGIPQDAEVLVSDITWQGLSGRLRVGYDEVRLEALAPGTPPADLEVRTLLAAVADAFDMPLDDVRESQENGSTWEHEFEVHFDSAGPVSLWPPLMLTQWGQPHQWGIYWTARALVETPPVPAINESEAQNVASAYAPCALPPEGDPDSLYPSAVRLLVDRPLGWAWVQYYDVTFIVDVALPDCSLWEYSVAVDAATGAVLTADIDQACGPDP